MKSRTFRTLICAIALIVTCAMTFSGCALIEKLFPPETPDVPETTPVDKIMINGVESELTLKQGEEITVTASTNVKATDRKVVWSVSDPTLLAIEASDDAPVNTCKVTAASDKSGEATLTATANDGSGVKAEVKITVVAPAEVLATANQTNIPDNANGAAAGTITFGSDGSLEVDGYYNGLGVQVTCSTTYKVEDGVLTIASAEASAFGMTDNVNFTVSTSGGISIKMICDSDLTKSTNFALSDEDAKALGIAVASKVDVQSITASSNSLTVKAGEKIDLKTLITFAPADATVKDLKITPAENAGVVVVEPSDETIYFGLGAGTVEFTVESVDNPEAKLTVSVTVEEYTKPESLGANYFSSAKKFNQVYMGASLMNTYILGTDGSVKVYGKTGVYEQYGWYSLDTTEDSATKLTLYTIRNAATNDGYTGDVYTLVKGENGLYTFDVGAPLGMPDAIIASEAAYLDASEVLGAEHFESDLVTSVSVFKVAFNADGTWTLAMLMENIAPGYYHTITGGVYGIKTEGDVKNLYYAESSDLSAVADGKLYADTAIGPCVVSEVDGLVNVAGFMEYTLVEVAPAE